ncbi:hemin uptake protein HemP [Immundisolibacter sp.]|uniref:hemin uptake protein HemP n=1 Tax=Immundisolibacter sp. TaxID=1934948 RepID=UPI003563A8FF
MPPGSPRPTRPAPDRRSAAALPKVDPVPRYDSEQLFAGTRRVAIVHAGREYSLRLTAANKLILTA